MIGYEKYVVGIYQHIFDRGDWNIITYDVDNLNLKSATIENYFEYAKKKRLDSYTKDYGCFSCKFFNICDGIEHKLKSIQEVYPVKGEKIKDVQLLRRGHYPEC
jgi:radical SAM protein with 4Fe4S-binding SPASM domain